MVTEEQLRETERALVREEFRRASALAGAPSWSQPSSCQGTVRYPDPPKLMDAKTCREKLRRMLIGGPGARIFLACLRERINELDEADYQL